jgi:hypothetical protein
MDNQQFVASLVSSLAWPVAVVIVALVFRRPIGEMIDRLEHVKSPLFEGWAKARAETRLALAASPAPAPEAAVHGPLTDDFAALAATAPIDAILRAWNVVETLLREYLELEGVPKARTLTFDQMTDTALKVGLMTRDTANGIKGLANLRTVALHGVGEKLDSDKALDFLALADAVVFTIEYERSRRRTRGRG